jgi:hypothetical protein
MACKQYNKELACVVIGNYTHVVFVHVGRKDYEQRLYMPHRRVKKSVNSWRKHAAGQISYLSQLSAEAGVSFILCRCVVCIIPTSAGAGNFATYGSMFGCSPIALKALNAFQNKGSDESLSIHLASLNDGVRN